MNYLAEALEHYLEEHFRSALTVDSEAAVRPILVGPPCSCQLALFNRLTSSGTSEWHITVGTTAFEVVVLLVGDSLPPTPAGVTCVSKACHWDYAVTVRNSRKLVLMIVDPQSWDSRPDSLRNTTETIGTLAFDKGGRWLQDSLWRFLVERVVATSGVERWQIKDALKTLVKQGVSLDAAHRNAVAWSSANQLLAPAPGTLQGIDAVAFACGFPAPTGSLDESAHTLEVLAKFLGDEGLAEGIAQLKQTNTATTQGLATHLDALLNHLNSKVLSGATFARSSARYYQPDSSVPAWWPQVTPDRIGDMLTELRGGPVQGRLRLACTNAINANDRIDGEPLIVATQVDLRATDQTGNSFPTGHFSRRLPRAARQAIPSNTTDPALCEDVPPVHQAALKYEVDGQAAYRPAQIDVLALDSFACAGTARVQDAVRNKPPFRRRGQAAWRQEIALPRAGSIALGVFHSSAVETVRLEVPKENSTDTRDAVAGSRSVSFPVDIEHGDTVKVGLLDAAGNELNEWEIEFSVEEPDVIASNLFEALVQAHQHQGRGRIARPQVPNISIQHIESSYLSSSESWKSVMACWPQELPTQLTVDWSTRRIGSHFPDIDPWPAVAPPGDLLAAREAVRMHLAAKDRPIATIDLGETALQPLVEEYVDAYSAWLETAPEQAAWFDCIALYLADWNQQANTYIATREPVAMILSPLHPLRLGWHALAQAQLSELVNDTAKRCPAAGLLDPSSCPDAGAWLLALAGQSSQRGYVAIECEHPHWAVLVNKEFVSKNPELTRMARCLANLGVPTKGIAGGFTRSQSIDSLNELVGLLPTRAILRVGIVGSPESSPASAEGVIEWCEEQFEEDNARGARPFFVEIYDSRGASHPTEELLADLSETTGERVKWFKLGAASGNAAHLDLVIIDQLGTVAPSARGGDTTSAVGNGSLCRVRVRQDFHDGTLLRESRRGQATGTAAGLAAILQDAVTAFEGLAANDGATQFEFQPVQQAIGTRLEGSTFVAITSSQIDPACIIRGARGQGGYLWNYELPGALGGAENRVGYYLIAKPGPAMTRAVERSAELITATPPNTQLLLDEISRRGIPIMKKLAGGGSSSRGELGLLLAVRLLQDAFRSGPTNPQLPVWCGECVHLILPLDPYRQAFERIRAALRTSESQQRPDIVVLAIRVPASGGSIQLKITPVEVKFREGIMGATAARDALGQAANLGTLFNALWTQPASTELWANCRAALLAQCVDFSFRVYANPNVHRHTHEEWTALHERVLAAILGRSADISITGAGRLLIFDESSSTAISDLDGDGRQDTAIVNRDDAEVLLTGSGTLSHVASEVARRLDFTFPSCLNATTASASGPMPPASQGNSVAVAPPEPAAASGPDDDSDNAAPGSGGGQSSQAAAATQAVEEVPGAPSDSPPAASPPPATAAQSAIPPDVRQQVRDAFDGFIGNATAVKRITNDLLRALIENPPFLAKNYLFTGQPSTGKTEMARRMSMALGLPFVKLDGRGVQSRQRLFDLIDGELNQQGQPALQSGQSAGMAIMQYPPLVVFIDEVHLVPRGVQESLLTMLEAADRTVTLDEIVARVNRATFLFATTRASDVDTAFRTRCAEVQLREYELEEVAEIVHRKFGDAWPVAIYTEIALLGRSIPRVALELAKELETELAVTEHPDRPIAEHLEEVRKARDIDPLGLTLSDRAYLQILERENRPVGEQGMLNMLGTVDRDRVLNEVEPFLRRLGFLRLGPRGREITDEGKQYVLNWRMNR